LSPGGPVPSARSGRARVLSYLPERGRPSSSSRLSWGASAAQAADKGPGCGLVPASVVDGAYGARVTGPTAQTKGPVTVCSYFSSAPVVSVLVRFEVNETVAMFKAGRKSFTAHKDRGLTKKVLSKL